MKDYSMDKRDFGEIFVMWGEWYRQVRTGGVRGRICKGCAFVNDYDKCLNAYDCDPDGVDVIFQRVDYNKETVWQKVKSFFSKKL